MKILQYKKHLSLLLLFIATPYCIAQMPPLEPPVDPAGNPSTNDKIMLGKALYWDEQLSATKTVACASCHRMSSGGTDIRSSLNNPLSLNPGADGIFNTLDDIVGSQGVPESIANGEYLYNDSYAYQSQVTARLAPSSINAGYAPDLFYDGRATNEFKDPITNNTILASGAALESQVLAPPTSSVEMAHNNRDWNAVALSIKYASPLALTPQISNEMETWIGGKSYFKLFEDVFGTAEITPVRIAMAIASYERSLYSNQSPFDLMLESNDNSYLTIEERAGFQLFNSQGCNTCHTTALFSDHNYYNLGVTPDSQDSGRFAVTGYSQDMGKFKTPILRNLSNRTSFMHNGRFSSILEVVEFYNRGGDYNNPNKDVRIQPLFLSETQKSSLVAFLDHALTDPRVTAETGPFTSPTLFAQSSRVPLITGTGLAGTAGKIPQLVALEPPLLGNKSFTIALSNAKAGSTSTLVIDSIDPGTTTLPTTAYLIKTKILETSTNGDGHASVSVKLPEEESEIGSTFFARWYVEDSQAVSGYAVSRLLEFTLFKPNYGEAGLIYFSGFDS